MKGQTLLTHYAFTMPSCHWSILCLTLGSLGSALSWGSLRASAAPPHRYLLGPSPVLLAAASQDPSCEPSHESSHEPSCKPSYELSHEPSCELSCKPSH